MALTDKLTAIADAIRAKVGGSEPLTLDQMATEIAGIQGGGGNEDELVGRTLTAYTNNTVESIGITAFYNYQQLTEVHFPAATQCKARAFEGCSGLVTADMPRLTTAGQQAFNGCSALVSADFPTLTEVPSSMFYACKALSSLNLPVATTLEQYAFYQCTSLVSVTLPCVASVGGYAFQACTALENVDLAVAHGINIRAFYGCSKLASLTLRTTTSICTLGSNALVGTPIANGTGYVYVPSNLVESYKSNSSWSAYADQIVAIDEG